MTLDNVIGLPSGTIPEETDASFRDFLKSTILKSYKSIIESNDPIVLDSYLAEMRLYRCLYSECYVGK